MKCVVVVPPIEDFYYTPHRGSFLGARIVFLILKQHGHDVEFICFPNTKKPKTIPLPLELSYLKEFMMEDEIGPTCFFSKYKRFGPSYKHAARIVLKSDPKVIFISCFAFCYALPAIFLAEEIKKIASHKKIVLGGSGVSVYPEYFLDTSLFDVVLCGEAENVLTEFLDVPKIDTPLSLVVKTRQTKKVEYYSTYLTRGCPMGCRFCSVSLVHGNTLRRVNEQFLYREILCIPDNKNVFLNFEDDQILCDREMFLRSLKRINKAKPNIFFRCENGIDYRKIDKKLLDSLISLGFRQFNLSIGTTDEKLSREQKRRVDTSTLMWLSKELEKNHIDQIIYFIAGFKKETIEHALKDLVFLSTLGKRTRIGLSLFYPVPGIWGFEDREIFRDKSPVLSCSSSAWPWNNSLSTEEMITLFRLVRLVNLTRRKYIDIALKEVIGKSAKEKKLYTFTKYSTCPTEVKGYNRKMVKLFFEMIEKPLWSTP